MENEKSIFGSAEVFAEIDGESSKGTCTKTTESTQLRSEDFDWTDDFAEETNPEARLVKNSEQNDDFRYYDSFGKPQHFTPTKQATIPSTPKLGHKTYSANHENFRNSMVLGPGAYSIRNSFREESLKRYSSENPDNRISSLPLSPDMFKSNTSVNQDSRIRTVRMNSRGFPVKMGFKNSFGFKIGAQSSRNNSNVGHTMGRANQEHASFSASRGSFANDTGWTKPVSHVKPGFPAGEGWVMAEKGYTKSNHEFMKVYKKSKTRRARPLI